MHSPENARTITAHVYRSRTRSLQPYVIDSAHPISVMSLVAQLHQKDPTLACRTSMCFHGTCGSCFMNVNGQDVKGCTVLVNPGETVYLRPHSRYKVLQDLVVDFNQPLTSDE